MIKIPEKPTISKGLRSMLLSTLPDPLLHLLALQLLQRQERDAELVVPGKRLSHLPQPLLRNLHSLLDRQVAHRVPQVLLYPPGQLEPLVGPLEPLVGQDHDAVVRLAAEDAADALGSVAHSVERQEVVFSDLESVPEVLEPSLESGSGSKLVDIMYRTQSRRMYDDW